MTERIQKIISASGLASRRHAEEWIQAGRVTCNGEVCVLGQRADPQKDVICVDGKALPSTPASVYIMLNKPRGYVTTLQDEKGRKDAAQLVRDCGCRVYPIGRLDMDSEGLLLFTNDGEFANLLMHPKHEVKKTYHVSVSGFTEENFRLLGEPVELDGYRIRKPLLRLISSNGSRAVIEITIHEGRNRQIRRMCQTADMQVERLKRISEGLVKLGDLPVGKWRYLTEAEISALMKE